MYIWIIKFITLIGTLLSSLVFNFHKPIKGIKTKHNLKYKKKGNHYNKLDVHFQKDKTEEKKPCIIYFHGGGWACYSKSIYTTLSRRLANMGYVVFNVNYGLAPIYKMDNIVSDAVSAIKFAREIAPSFGGDPDQITLAGDSAGAHISSLVTGMVNSGEIDFPELKGKIKSLILLYGVYDIDTTFTSGFPNIQTYLKVSLHGKVKDKNENRKYSPVEYVSGEFPPVFMASGEIDKLHKSQSAVMAKKLEESGVELDRLFFAKKELRAMHAYMIFDGLETNVKTLKHIEKFLKGVYEK